MKCELSASNIRLRICQVFIILLYLTRPSKIKSRISKVTPARKTFCFITSRGPFKFKLFDIVGGRLVLIHVAGKEHYFQMCPPYVHPHVSKSSEMKQIFTVRLIVNWPSGLLMTLVLYNFFHS